MNEASQPPDLNNPGEEVPGQDPKGSGAKPGSDVLLELAQVGIGAQGAEPGVCLEDVNWRIERGQLWVIGGPPESGKSALLATAAGLMEPMAGQVLVKGKSPTGLSEAQRIECRLGVGLVHEAGLKLFHNLTLEENIALPLRYHRNWTWSQAEAKLRILLDFLELTPWRSRLPEQVNRACRQRAVLARALAVEPELLLMDNPLAGMGPSQIRWWLDLMDHLWRGQTALGLPPITLAVTTDGYRPWLGFQARFALLKGRQWIFLGAREDLFASEEPLVRELLSDNFTPESS
jgi:phospholipid/cholesterol/gamma-HCH transport system ATP-binding protein